MLNQKNIALWVLMALSILVFFWLNNSENDDADISIELELPENPPDIYITGMTLTRFDSNGQINMTTKAANVAIYEETGENLLSQPVVTLTRNNVATWRISANNAILYANDDIDFLDQVKILQLNDTPATRIDTEFIKVTNKGDLIVTDKPVQIIKGKQSINAIGMEAKLDTIEPIINLLSDVSFHYDPSN